MAYRSLILLLGLLLLAVPARPQTTETWPSFSSTTIVQPTGNSTTDYTNLSTAFAGSATTAVYLAPGLFNVCQQLTVPAGGMVFGQNRINNLFYFNTGFAHIPAAIIKCSGSSSFSSGQAHIVMSSRATLDGVGIEGLGNSATLVDCVQLVNVEEVYVGHVNCQQPSDDGFALSSNASSTPTQGVILDHDYVSNAKGCALHLTATPPGFVNDNQAYGFWSNSSGYGSTCNGEIFENFGSINLTGVRAEDSSGFGLEIRGIGAKVTGCEINQNEIDLIFDTATSSTITGCTFNSGGFHGAPASVVKWLNGSSDIIMSGNVYGGTGGGTQTVNVWGSAGSPTCTRCFIYDQPSVAGSNVSGSLYDGTPTQTLVTGSQLTWP